MRGSSTGVTIGYLLAAGLAAVLWVGVGVLLLPVMVIMAAVHVFAKSCSHGPVHDHHRWLARHHLLSVAALIVVLVVPLLAIPALLSDMSTVLNTLAQAPHPIETLIAAWPSFIHLPVLIGSGLIFYLGWYVVTFWISFRLVRHGLMWAEDSPVRGNQKTLSRTPRNPE